jgi:L-cysteine S-thiosulfotransferase
MVRRSLWLAVAALAVIASGCDSGRRSAAGFRLPPDGDIERGKTAFVTLGCNACHEVAGVDLPKATTPAVMVLGGDVYQVVGDGKLVTKIISPSGRQVRMPHYSEKMTIRQLTDIVAFLQSEYHLRRVAPTGTYY